MNKLERFAKDIENELIEYFDETEFTKDIKDIIRKVLRRYGNKRLLRNS
jgi:hypothetical protein